MELLLCFGFLSLKRVSGLAVVNKNGTIVDAVSASDLMVSSAPLLKLFICSHHIAEC